MKRFLLLKKLLLLKDAPVEEEAPADEDAPAVEEAPVEEAPAAEEAPAVEEAHACGSSQKIILHQINNFLRISTYFSYKLFLNQEYLMRYYLTKNIFLF